MTGWYNEKGKYFTEKLNKDLVKALIQTTSARIQGYLHIRKDERVLDAVNNSSQYIALTDDKILDSDGNGHLDFEFITLNRDQIIWILPMNEPGSQDLPDNKGQ